MRMANSGICQGDELTELLLFLQELERCTECVSSRIKGADKKMSMISSNVRKVEAALYKQCIREREFPDALNEIA